MLLREFPNLQWLKSQAEHRFANLRDAQGNSLPHPGWPTVILNTRTAKSQRTGIKGPFSIFMNLKGSSHCQVEKHRVRVEEGMYFLSNKDQYYDLEIDNQEETETFNIHFGEDFLERVSSGLTDSVGQWLEPETSFKGEVIFPNRLFRFSAPTHDWLRNFQANFPNRDQKLYEEEKLTELLQHILWDQEACYRKMQQLPNKKPGYRQEVYRRLTLAVDYLHSYYHCEISLEELARIACLSRFHFLRLFKMCLGITPYQYLTQLRLEKACDLLKDKRIPITAIADELGFAHANSFSRLFGQRFGLSPVQYRMQRAWSTIHGGHN